MAELLLRGQKKEATARNHTTTPQAAGSDNGFLESNLPAEIIYPRLELQFADIYSSCKWNWALESVWTRTGSTLHDKHEIATWQAEEPLQ